MLARINSLVLSIAIGGLFAALGACGGGGGPVPPAAPSKPLNLSGTWSGHIGQSGSMSALRLTWIAVQRGNEVAGVAIVVKPRFDVQVRGVITGTISGSRLSLTFLAESDFDVEGLTRCQINGLGNASAAENEITGSMQIVARSCTEIGIETTSSTELRLVR